MKDVGVALFRFRLAR